MSAGGDYPSDWDQRRKRVYKRDEYTCQWCGAQGGPHGNRELHADHKVPISEGGSHKLGNLQTLCRNCHNEKTEIDTGRNLDGRPSGDQSQQFTGGGPTTKQPEDPKRLEQVESGKDRAVAGGISSQVPGPKAFGESYSTKYATHSLVLPVLGGGTVGAVFTIGVGIELAILGDSARVDVLPVSYYFFLAFVAGLAMYGFGKRRANLPETPRCPSCADSLYQTDVRRLWYCPNEDLEWQRIDDEFVDGFAAKNFSHIHTEIPRAASVVIAMVSTILGVLSALVVIAILSPLLESVVLLASVCLVIPPSPSNAHR